MFIPWYCKSIHVFTPLSYRLRAHTAVLPCKHFWLPASAMFFCSLRAVTHVPFPENTEKWAADHTHTACTSDPLYILSKVAVTEAAEGPLAENEGKRGGKIEASDRNKIGKHAFQEWRNSTEGLPRLPVRMRGCSKGGNDTVAAAQGVKHSISSYSETRSFGLWRELLK